RSTRSPPVHTATLLPCHPVTLSSAPCEKSACLLYLGFEAPSTRETGRILGQQAPPGPGGRRPARPGGDLHPTPGCSAEVDRLPVRGRGAAGSARCLA